MHQSSRCLRKYTACIWPESAGCAGWEASGEAGPRLDTVTGEPQGVRAAGDAGHGETSWGIKPQVMLGDTLKARVGVDGSGEGLADKGEPGKSCRCFPLSTRVTEMSTRQGAPGASRRRGTEIGMMLMVLPGWRRAKTTNTLFIKCFETNTSQSTSLQTLRKDSSESLGLQGDPTSPS